MTVSDVETNGSRAGILRRGTYAMLLWAGKRGNRLEVEALLMRFDKAGIVCRVVRLDAHLDLTEFCYAGGAQLCGRCDS